MIKVSIITPVYNSADVIGETILSVLKQAYKEWEMIIVDDGSADAISEVVDEYAKKDGRIKFFRQDNAGASAARNTGIKHANYEWLLFLDADDWIHESYFENMIRALEQDPSIDVVHCGWTRVQKNGSMSKEVYGGEEIDMFPALSYYSPFAIHSCIVRKKLVEDVGGFDTSFKTCVDWDLWQRVARTGARFFMVKETMAFYRTRAYSLSSNVHQFCLNGLQVISNAYVADPRVSQPNPDYANGLKADDLITRMYHFVIWCAGVLIGQGKEASGLLEHLKNKTAEHLDGNLAGQILTDSLIIPAEKEQNSWHIHWKVIEDNLKCFLSDLEQQTYSTSIADKACAVIEHHVILQSAAHIKQQQVGKSFAVQIDLESPVPGIEMPVDAERFIGIVWLQEKILDLIELPVTDRFLAVTIIKNAVATKLSWQILYYFFLKNVYPFHQQTCQLKLTEEIHDKIGWEFFLQELWNKPLWTNKIFYDPHADRKEKALKMEADDEIFIEISEALPSIKTRSSELKIHYFVGGVHAGIALCRPNGRSVTPQMIRAAITLAGGYELCRLVVREAVVGQKLDNGFSLLERLKIAREKTLPQAFD
jgi:glycosyltransferase involved in cell wall biosynthesis